MKTSLKNDLARIQFRLTQELTSFREQHAAGEQNRLRIARGNTLNRISKIIRQVAAMGDPWQILAVESHCEQFYLDFFAKTTQAIQASIQSLRTISRLRDTLTAPFDPERYKNNLRKSIGAQNMDKLPPVPRDDFHLFVRSQVQRLTKAPGQLATPPEAEYFYARKEALQTALKLHEKNCEQALGTHPMLGTDRTWNDRPGLIDAPTIPSTRRVFCVKKRVILCLAYPLPTPESGCFPLCSEQRLRRD